MSVALVIYFEIANRNFLTNANIQTVSQFVAAPVIIACGEIMLLICREIDLSVGQVFALAPFLMENVHDFGLPVMRIKQDVLPRGSPPGMRSRSDRGRGGPGPRAGHRPLKP